MVSKDSFLYLFLPGFHRHDCRMASATREKREPLSADDAEKQPEHPVDEGTVEVPYSIYTSNEKWLIVAMVALAGFYRYAN